MVGAGDRNLQQIEICSRGRNGAGELEMLQIDIAVCVTAGPLKLLMRRGN